MLPESTCPEAFDAERSALAGRVIDAVSNGIRDDADFNELAMAVFQHQIQWNLPYKEFVRSQGRVEISHWSQFPAVATDVFKIESLPLVCGPSEATRHRFRTSGTTGESRGTHFFHSLDVYEASIEASWIQLELPKLPLYSLTLPPEDWQESSLGHMVGVLQRMLPSGGGCYLEKSGQFRFKELMVDLRALPSDQPVQLFGTALGFLNWFEEMDAAAEVPLNLPPGSVALETGGYKGSGRELEKSDLYHEFESHLRLPPDRIVNEYSMTELSSQFYTEGIGNAHRGPSWTRVRVIDPETHEEVALGDTGYVEIFDLANIDSVAALQTRDLAVRCDDGTFELIGRDPEALPRGCSRAADELMGATN